MNIKQKRIKTELRELGFIYSFTLLQEFYLILKVLPEGYGSGKKQKTKQGETA
jgi:hypothetical protein